MLNSNKTKSTISTGICVKVSPQELNILKRDSSKLNKSAPALFREKYFNTPSVKPLMTNEEVAKLRSDINRIGNNINQIAREINSGVRHGWNSSFEVLAERVKLLNQYIVLKYGIHQS